MKKEILEAQLEILLELPYMIAYLGSFQEGIIQSSYTPYSEVTKRISKIRKELDEIKYADVAQR